MARKDSRSPSPAGRRRDDDRRDRRDRDRDRDRDRRDGPRDHRRRSRSPVDVSSRHRHTDREISPGRSDRQHMQRRYRDRDRDRDHRDYNRGGRGQDSYRRDDDYGRSNRDRERRRSRDRLERPRSPDRRRHRSRDHDHRAGKEDPREPVASRREGTAETTSRRGDDVRPKASTPSKTDIKEKNHDEPAKSTTQTQSEAEKKAERLRKIQAMKEKLAKKEAQDNNVATGSTRKLLVEMDQKASDAFTPDSAASPVTTQDGASPLPYAGKFDPKAIAKNSKAHRGPSPTRLGDVKLGDVKLSAPASKVAQSAIATDKRSLLSANRAKSRFGFNKAAAKLGADAEKPSFKRKIDMDDEDISRRKLVKLPDASLESADETPCEDQEDEQEGEEDLDFAKDEEEMAASARAAQERREERIVQQSNEEHDRTTATDSVVAMDIDGEPPVSETKAKTAQDESMTVDELEEEDALDAFMASLDGAQSSKEHGNKTSEPEMYFGDDDYGYEADSSNPATTFADAIAATRKKKKDIPTIDYSKLNLKPVRKNFWVEPYELSQLTEEETADLRVELDGIKVAGKDVPKPVQKWSHCGLTQPLLTTIDMLGYEKPTPIQMQALPIIMSGRDTIGIAKTGSGKTMAFLLPMFRHIMDQDPLADTDGPIGLIMTPTRELAIQIHRDCKPFLKALNLRAVAAYGGAPITEQIAELKRGAEIVVATPGRMIDLLAANQGRVTNLKRATYLVLDEADRMFDMGFEPQVMKIFNNLRPDRQTILFSATMPRLIDSLTKKVLRNPVEIIVGGRSVVAPEITQVIEIREEKDKFNRLLELLGELYANDDDVRALIFVERQEKADDLLKELFRRGWGCDSIHGGKDQADRDSAISDFKKGALQILIATSIAARGLDVKQLKLVVNYDAPNHLEDYVHRAGRTGRAGNTGTAVTFITEEQENCAPGIAKALEQSGQPVPERLNEMRKAFREKVKSGKAKDSTGFGGKGLEKLDKEREAVRLLQRKAHKGDGDEEEEQEDNKKDEEKLKKAKDAVKTAVSAIVSRDAAKAEAAEAAKTGTMPSSDAAKPATPSGVAKGGDGALNKASSVIDAINARLARAGALRPGQPVDNKGPDAGAFHATLEINDFPQKARWSCTNRTNVAKILDQTGVSITSKGIYVAPGKEVPPGGEPKLYILIEGDTEIAVSNALSELTRLLREGTIAAAEAENRAPASGRYTIT